MSTRNLTPELVRETLRRADSPLALGAAIARAGRAAGVAISDADGVEAVVMPAAEVLDWRKGCVVEQCRDARYPWCVLSPDRSSFLKNDGREWSSPKFSGAYTQLDRYGNFSTQEEALGALALSTTPYPGYKPPVDEARKATDLGDGMGLEEFDPDAKAAADEMAIAEQLDGEQADRERAEEVLDTMHDQPRRTLGATLAAMPELARNPNPTNSLRIVGRLAMKPVPGGFDLFNATGTRVASMSVGWNSHMDPGMQQTPDQAKAIGQALVDLWNADYDVTTQQVHTDTMDKLQTDRT